jgi:hypothetical protein
MTIPVQTRASTPIPAADEAWIFLDSENGNAFTIKYHDCSYAVVGSMPSASFHGDCDCACDLAKEVVEAASCSLEKGMITPEQYLSIINGLNLYSVSTPNPDTGACSNSITTSPALAISATVENVSCNGLSDGVATFNISGGTGPYTVALNGGADPSALAAGTYTATVTDADGKTAAVTFIVTEPTPMSVSFSLSDGPTVLATVTGGSGAYTYVWDGPGIITGDKQDIALTVLGDYIVTATDTETGCTVVATYTWVES